jgi:succinate dehydrogenase / fumarate reductase, cytochrome b subunit
MKQKPTPPIHFNFLAMHFPLTAWVSIAHRLSGLWLFLLIPYFLLALEQSLFSEYTFGRLRGCLDQPFFKIILLSFLAALCYHCVAGLRHLLMDLGLGVTKKTSTATAALTLIMSVLLFLGLLYRFAG